MLTPYDPERHQSIAYQILVEEWERLQDSFRGQPIPFVWHIVDEFLGKVKDRARHEYGISRLGIRTHFEAGRLTVYYFYTESD